MYGLVTERPSKVKEQILVRFENKYAYKIAVHWIDPAGGDLQLYTLEANSATDMRTTEGHVYFAK